MPLIPIFISSTFGDFHAERDLLATEVRARLDDTLAGMGCRVAMVDLRWGIDTLHLASEEAREQRIFEVCFAEIDRSLPLFVGLLGRRYGWCLPPHQLRLACARIGIDQIDALDRSITALEIEYGALRRPPGHAVFFMRDLEGGHAASWVDAIPTNIDELRRHVTDARSDSVVHYKVAPVADSLGHDDRARFVEVATAALTPVVLSRAAELVADDFDPYVAAEQLFIDDRTRSFVGRDGIVHELVRLLTTGRKLCLVGDSGAGKSAIWAAVVTALRQRGATLATAALGIAPDTTSEAAVIARMQASIGRADGPEEPLQVRRERLWRVLRANPQAVLAIDALDALDPDTSVDDIALLLGDQVQAAVLCTTTMSEHARVLQRVGFEAIRVDQLSAHDAAEMVRAIGDELHRTLPTAVVEVLARQAPSPLWARVAVGELTALGERDLAGLPRGIEPIVALLTSTAMALPTDFDELMSRVLTRLEHRFGEELARSILLAIAVSRDGISPDDLAAMHSTLPLEVASMRQGSAGLVVSRGREGRLQFSHSLSRSSVRKRYSQDILTAHTSIARHLVTLSGATAADRTDLAYHALLSGGGFSPRPYLDRSLDTETVDAVAQAVREALATLARDSDRPAAALLAAIGEIDDPIIEYFTWWSERSGSSVAIRVRCELGEHLVSSASKLAPARLPELNKALLLSGLAQLRRPTQRDFDHIREMSHVGPFCRALNLVACRRVFAAALLDDGARRAATDQLRSAGSELHYLSTLLDAFAHLRNADVDRHGDIDEERASQLAAAVEAETERVKVLRARSTLGVGGLLLGTKAERQRVDEAIEAARTSSAPVGRRAGSLAEALLIGAEQSLHLGEPARAVERSIEALDLIGTMLQSRDDLAVQLLHAEALLIQVRARLARPNDRQGLVPSVSDLADRTEHLLSTNPGSDLAALLRARTYGVQSTLANEAGDGDGAYHASSQEIQLLHGLHEADDSELATRISLIDALHRGSQIAEVQGRTTEARAWSQEAWALRQVVQEADPSRSLQDVVQLRARAHQARAAESNSLLGRLNRMGARAKAELAIDKLVDAGDEAHGDDEYEVAIGQLTEALRRLEDSVVVDRWPEAKASSYRAAILEALARSERGAGRTLNALEHQAMEVEARRHHAAAARKGRSSHQARADLAAALALHAMQLFRADRFGDASVVGHEAVDMLTKLVAQPPDDHDYEGLLHTLQDVVSAAGRMEVVTPDAPEDIPATAAPADYAAAASDLQPAGWYRAAGDLPHTQRYWDGRAWVGGPEPIPGEHPGDRPSTEDVDDSSTRTAGSHEPAGWYYARGDPVGTMRYWTGSLWQGGPVPDTSPRPASVVHAVPDARRPQNSRRALDRYTGRARRAIVLAREEARQLGHRTVGSEHLLLGLIHEGEGSAARALKAAAVTLDTARREVELVVGPGTGDLSFKDVLPFTSHVRSILEASHRQAREAGHAHTQTNHILLGLLVEDESTAIRVLTGLGVDVGELRRYVQRPVGESDG